MLLYFLNLLDAYSRLVFLFFILIDCGLMFLIHQFYKKTLPVLYRYFSTTRKLLIIADRESGRSDITDFEEIVKRDIKYIDN